MRVLLRADASTTQGTGHVMRVLTLAEELRRSGAEVHLATNLSEITWLEEMIRLSAVKVHRVEQHSMDLEMLSGLGLDWVVVDSYVIPENLISEISKFTRVLAIVDGDTRGIIADLYLDHNLGSESLSWPPEIQGKLLAGSSYSLIRDAILKQRRRSPWEFHSEPPHVLVVMGGSDPTGTSLIVVKALDQLQQSVKLTVISPPELHNEIELHLANIEDCAVLSPTPDLPEILGQADVVVSAAGTSAWEICSLGIPAILIAVVGNQSESLEQLLARRFVLGFEAEQVSDIEFARLVGQGLLSLLSDKALRRELSINASSCFDGRGKERVVKEMSFRSANVDQ